MFQTTIRTAAIATTAFSMALATASCGGDDDAEAAPSADASAAIEEVTTCLTNAGFEVTREADRDPANVLPEEYKESVGLIESVELGFIGDVKGIGSVAFYTSTDAAEEDFEGASGMRTDDVLAGVVGTETWDYIVTAGDDPGVTPMIENCIGRADGA